MTGLPVPLALAFSGTLVIVGGFVALRMTHREARIDARIRGLHIRPSAAGPTAAAARESVRETLLRAVSDLGQWVLRRRMLSRKMIEGFEKSLAGAGLRGGSAMRLFIGGKLALMLIMPLLLWLAAIQLGLSPTLRMWLPAGGILVGMLTPDFIINRLRDRHAKRIGIELPDALDMMVICAQAGLGLGPMILRVAEELQNSHKSVATEFGQTADELQISTDAQVALTRLGERSGVEAVRRLATTLVQSAQYGTPLSAALRGLAAELRTELVTRYEARAARLPVLLTVPMIMFVLPSLFLVVGGPAVLEVMRAFKH